MTRSIAIRLGVEGGEELKRELQDAGQAGQAAFQNVGVAADQASAATEKLSQKSQQAAAAARQAQAAAGSPASSGSPPVPANFIPSPGTSREVEAIRRRLDEDYRNQRQRDRDSEIINRGAASGAFDEAEQSRLRYLSQRKYAVNDNKPEGLNTYDKLFVKYQATDVAQGLFAGQSPATVALQQGGQVFQQLSDREGGISAGLKQLGVSAAGLVTPLTVASTAAAAFGAAFVLAGVQAGKEQEAMERATRGLGTASGATASMIADLADANAKSGKLSSASAREVSAAYVATGRIALPVVGDLTRVTSDYAKLIGTDVPTATAELARAFSDPARGVDELAAKLGGLDDRTRQLIQTQVEQGDKAGAQKTAADYLKATVESNTVAATGWAAAWLTVSSAADTAWSSLKRVAGVSLGAVPEGTQDAINRIEAKVKAGRSPANAALDPLGYDLENDRAQLAALRERLTREQAEAARKADVERARTLSLEGNAIARGIDPNGARLSDLTKQQSTLRDTLSNPTYSETMTTEDFKRLRDGYDAVTNARESLIDVNGKAITSEERVRQQNQLALDMAKAKTDAEKAEIAAKQKRLELAGQPLTRSDIESQVDYAKRLSLASASKGGGDSDKTDEFDRAVRSTEDRTRRLAEESATYGMGAEAVARYRTELELTTAATRAERDMTPELTDRIRGLADSAAAAARRVEDLREGSRRTEDYRSIGSDGVRTLVRDLADGARAGKVFEDVLGGIKNRAADLASTSISDMIFGKRGSADGGLLSSLFNAGGSSGAGLVSTLKGFLGFDGGGYTGPGGVLEPAGVVHRGEIVWSQRDIERAGGVGTVEAMRLGRRGYDRGGYVSPYTMPGRAGMAPAANGNFNVTVIESPGGEGSDADGARSRRRPAHDRRDDFSTTGWGDRQSTRPLGASGRRRSAVPGLGEVPRDEKVERLRSLIGALRERSLHPEIFAAVEDLATSDGEWMAAQLSPLIGKNIGRPDIEGAAIGIMTQFICDRQQTFRRDGTPELELAAYSALISLKVAGTFGGFAADIREASRASRH